MIPNSIDLASYSQVDVEKQARRLIFTGSFSFTPNFDAMAWFVREVLPALREEVPGIELVITGDHGGRTLPDMDGVTLTGMVDDVRPWIASATVSLAPIFTGGGSRLKILEAMALRTPVVATSKGAEGLAVESGKHLLIADSADGFRRAVVGLLGAEEERWTLADNAYSLVRDQYDSAVVHRQLSELIAEITATDTERQ